MKILNDITIYDNTIDGKCSGCGECCSNLLPLSEQEISNIKAYIKKHKIKEQRHNAMVGVDMTCPFRDDVNKKCLIYSIRPAICRQFVCNHTQEDIMKAKFDFHNINRVVFMRSEFFNNKEDFNFMADLMKGLFNG